MLLLQFLFHERDFAIARIVLSNLYLCLNRSRSNKLSLSLKSSNLGSVVSDLDSACDLDLFRIIILD